MTMNRVAVGAGLVLIVGLAVGGYLFGVQQATTESQANEERELAYRAAAREARESAFARSRERGLSKGLDQGQQQGEAAGSEDGKEAGVAEADARLAAEAALSAASACPPDYSQGTTGCVVTDPDHIFSPADAQAAAEEYDANLEIYGGD